MDVDNSSGNVYLEEEFYHARVAELVDALDLGSSPPERIGVQLPSLAPISGSFDKIYF
jgi:hypothetical protein